MDDGVPTEKNRRKPLTMLRTLKICALMFFGAVVGISLALLAMFIALQPDTKGITSDQFQDPDRAVASLVRMPDSIDRRPNLIVILADDLGFGDVGAYGGSVIETPNIDRMASEGMLFTNAYSSAAVCSPSRAGLLTGRYPLRSGIVAAMQMADDGFARKAAHQAGIVFSGLAAVDLLGGGNAVDGLPPSEITIPEALNAAGYRSMAIGKWHLGDFTQWPQYHPLQKRV